MDTVFAKLFSLRLFHEYQRSRVGGQLQAAAPLRLTPTKLCQSRLRDAGLVFRTHAEGADVFLRSEPAAGGAPPQPLDPHIPLPERCVYSFWLETTDPWFYHYSELPLTQATPGLYVFRNELGRVHTVDSEPRAVLSSSDSSPYAAAGDWVEVAPASFVHVHQSATSVQGHVEDTWGRTVHAGTLAPDSEDNCTYPIDLSGKEPGNYAVFINGQQQRNVYYEPELGGRAAFGLVRIVVDAALPASHALRAVDGTPTPKVYSLYIDVRATTWRYRVSLGYRTDTAAADLTMTLPSEDGDTVLTREAMVEEDGVKVVPFVTPATLKLRADPIKNIKLNKGDGQTPGAFELKNLPNPNPASLKQGEGQELFSDILLYI